MDVKQMLCSLSPLPFHFLLLLVFVYIPSTCNSRPIIFNFGDSNSDTGTYFITRGMIAQIPQNIIHSLSLHVPEGSRMSDGRIVLDFLCDNLNNTHYLSPFLESLTPNFTNGVNFAMAGAAALPKFGFFSLHIQVQQLGRLKYHSLELSSKGVQGLFGEDFANALYMIDIGQNDLDQLVMWHSSYPDIVEGIPPIISEIESALSTLYVQGARKFWVHNTGPLGCLPKTLTAKNYSASDLDQYGCARVANDAAREFNEQLRQLCDHFNRQMYEANVVYVDVFSIKYDIIANSSVYGFESPVKACCGSGGGQYNYNPNLLCGTPGFQICDNVSHYISWDGAHYTEAANKLVANKILSTRYSTPQLSFADLFLPVHPALSPAPTPAPS